MFQKGFVFVIFVSFLLFPIASWGQQGPGVPPAQGSPTTAPPAVEQPLIPEGVFAVQLAEALKLGPAQEEAQAESALSAVGIEPKNGWIAGYPVTPAVIGEIENGVAAAAEAGKLGMKRAEALQATKDLETRLGLNIMPGAPSPPSASAAKGGPGNSTIYSYVDRSGVVHYTDRYDSIPKEYRNRVRTIQGSGPAQPRSDAGPLTPPPPEWFGESNEPDYAGYARPGDMDNSYAGNPGPEVVNNYYDEYGPPVITYYPPPQPYAYLYSWVPGPFWYSGIYFPGFFILHDFHRRVFVHHRPCFVTNHFARGGRTFVVDPVTRNLRSGVKSGTPASQAAMFSAHQDIARSRRDPSPRVATSARAMTASSPPRGFSAQATAIPAPRVAQGSYRPKIVSGPPRAAAISPPSNWGRFSTPHPATMLRSAVPSYRMAGSTLSRSSLSAPRASGVFGAGSSRGGSRGRR